MSKPSKDAAQQGDNEERYRALINSIDVGFCVIEMLYTAEGKPFDYRFLEANTAFENNTGLYDAIGKTVRDFVPDHDDIWFTMYGDVVKTGQSIRFEDHAVAMNRWFDVYAQRVGLQEEHKVAVFFSDISARKSAEESVRLLEERERTRLTNLFMSAPAFMASLVGPQHIYELANGPYYQLIGRPENNSIVGKTVAETLPEVVEQGFIDLLDTVYRTGESYVGKDIPVSLQLSAEGPMEERIIDFTYQPLFDPDGTVTGILVHGVDLTERKRLEQERERLLEEQQQLVAELRDSSQRQRRFLKEMLAGFSEGRLLLCDTLDELPTLLALDAGAVPLTDTSLHLLRKNVTEVAKQVDLPAERLIDFQTAVHEAGMNAVKYGDGGTARIYADRDRGKIQVWISDQGPGIAEELIHRAMEPGWTTTGFGQGFFLMRTCADSLFLLTGQHGTTVVLEMERTPPQPAWLQGT
jgi:PAS domain S-box-containing protein